MAVHSVELRWFLGFGGKNLGLWLGGKCRVTIQAGWRGICGSWGGRVLYRREH